MDSDYSDYSDGESSNDDSYSCGPGGCQRTPRGGCEGGACSRGACARGGCGSSSSSSSSSSLGSLLPFDPSSIERIILSLCDNFDFRIILNDGRVRKAAMVTAGLSLAGTLIGKHYGGNFGAAVGGVVGGVCGIGIVVVSMREVWEEIKPRLHELMDVVYDYIAGLGINDYMKAASFLTGANSTSIQLGMMIAETTSQILGKKVLTSITGS